MRTTTSGSFTAPIPSRTAFKASDLTPRWGGYGNVPDNTPVPAYDPANPPSKQWNAVHGPDVSTHGFVYVCDRVNDHIQVFRKDGTFVTKAFFNRGTLRSGSVWGICIVLRSTLERVQRFIYKGVGPVAKRAQDPPWPRA